MASKDQQEGPVPVARTESIADAKLADGEVTEIQGDSNFLETVTAAPLNPWSKTSIQLYFILLVAALNATASGFDGVRDETVPLIKRHSKN
jgi:hypothetical protein